jgi:ligand-binding sensor domain-containing protein/signal transduction histidine kinase
MCVRLLQFNPVKKLFCAGEPAHTSLQWLIKIMVRRTLLLILTSFSALALHAQRPSLRFEHIGLEQGLSESIVLAIAQGTQGYMWFGTADGLNRYDGYDFKVYRNASEDSASLSANYVQALYNDRRGNLWVGTLAGLDLYDPAHERFIHYPYDQSSPRGKNEFNVNAIYESRSGAFWVGRIGAGLTKIHFDHTVFPPRIKELQEFREVTGSARGLNDDNVASIVEDRSGAIWIATWEGGLSRLDTATNTFTHFVHSPHNPQSLCKNFLRMLGLDSRGNLWIASEGNGLDRLNLREVDLQHPERTRFKHYPYSAGVTKGISYNIVRSLLEDREGRFWVGTDGGGLNVYFPESDSFVAYKHDKFDPTSLANDRLVSMYEDNAGTLWFGTWGSGVSRYSPSKEKFKHSPEAGYITAHLTSKFLLSIFQDRKGNLWFGTHSAGISKYDRATKRVHHFKHNPSNPKSLSNDVVWSMSEDPRGFMWLATDQGVNKLDPATGRFTRFLHDPNNVHSLRGNFVTRVHADADTNIWVATDKGLCKIDARTNVVTRFDHHATTGDSSSASGITAIHEDAAGTLWIGLGDFLRFDKKQERFVQFHSNANVPNKKNLNFSSSILAARSGMIWMGTYGYGLHGFNPSDESLVQFTEKNGLPNNVVYGILEDAQQNLWLSTNKGISRFNPTTKSFTNYDVKDGLQSNEFNRGAYFQSADGVIYFGGINGFNAFHPDSIRNNLHAPPVVLTAFKKYDELVNFGSAISAVAEIVLKHDDNFFSFEFAGLDYVDPENNSYAYILEGVDKRWVECGTRRYARYTNIDPGGYLFRVRAANSDGVWNERGASVKLRIVPPFWKTGWFMLVAGLALAGSFGGIVRFVSTRKLRQKLEALERERAIQHERERISRDLHDHVGAQLVNIISGLDLVGKYAPPTENRAQRLLKSLQQDARSSILQLRETIWAIKTKAMTLEAFCQQVENSARKQLEFLDVQLHFSSHCSATRELTPVQVLNSFRIVQEALTNCIKHAHAKNIWIEIVSDPAFRILVRDDGVGLNGMRRDELGGQGLQNMKRRAEEIAAAFQFRPLVHGVEVSVEIPLARNGKA